MSYHRMAEVYDRLMKDAPYTDWVSWTKEVMAEHHPGAKTILELGCGTGEITNRLADSYQMTGVDLSEDMLAIAANKDKRHQIQWLLQDISQLMGLSGYDAVISFCDVVNYIVREEQLLSVFKNAYSALQTNGLFLFDVHSLRHISNDLVGQTFAEVYDDLSYIWFCDQGEEQNTVEHDLTFFVKSGELFDRFDETHKQKGYSIDFLKEELRQVGFNILDIHSDFSYNSSIEGDRIFFVCQKV
ncbi:class I SAM-dependent DNA methyltransferase [Halobacillus sp. B23F22_1]|uniref:class I SAM-dependent DNA methyltransferase n=1 Tax=Halobacillus sp. B23F22_1 TaxID=3459514 RepID=UPI00373F2242